MQDITMVPDDVSFEFIRQITDDFSEERILGEGAFGVVYKGVTKNGQDVAVKIKKLKLCADPDNKQFRNEFHNLMKLYHQNIVQILGYCYETKKKPFIMLDGSKVIVDEIHTALCFEYLHNGSLQKHLSDESCELKHDDWHLRFKIIKGICEGLKYMHKDLEKPIYHLDLKPDNILLDKDMVPKIADFGLSKMFGQDVTWTTDNAYGTLGYQPPEYIDRREISGKFDIFSLGVIIIRIVSGATSYPQCLHMPSDEFIDQVGENWRKKLQEACSNSDSLLEAYCSQAETCTQIALNCLDEDSQKRPDIVKIIEKLNGIEVGVGKLAEKGCGINISEMTLQNSSTEMREESEDITVQHWNTDLFSTSNHTKLELIDGQETSTDVVEELIVGREEEKRKIISLLESSSENISILPIHGIGGIGKTTFSRLIYNDPKFECYSKAWVHVSNRFDLNKIRDSVISQLYEEESQANERQMIELLRGKKIMIVLDDLWEDNPFQLEDLKEMLYHTTTTKPVSPKQVGEMLYHNDSKIIILVTTRSLSVAERICTNLQPHKISHLTNDMCWDIIKQRSGFRARDDKEKLMGMGQEIAQKCAGVALAAQSLGFTLRGMSFDQWMKVKDDNIWKEYVSQDISMPHHVLPSLMLSYTYMDPCLKLCFTYCAIFPKGHKIVKNDLIYQWISLGFIKPTKLLSIMELCKKYIMQLQGLSFFQASFKSSETNDENAIFFTMHDLVHDLAMSLLGNQILDQGTHRNTRGSSCQYALLADCSKPLELYLTSFPRLIALRFLDSCSTELRGAAFAPARSLRVLDLSECRPIQKLPDSIGELKQLRYLNAPGIQDQFIPDCITELSKLNYLDISGSEISALPESLGRFTELEYLDLSGCDQLEELPASFGELSRLVHLNLSFCSRLDNIWDAWRDLTQMQYLNLGQCSISLFRERQQVSSKGLQEAMSNLTALRFLNLSNSRYLLYGGQLVHDSFPGWISNLTNLEHLDLSTNRGFQTVPGSFGELKKLHTLDLSFCMDLQWLPKSISEIDSLKFLNTMGCIKLDKSTLPQFRRRAVLLPHFVVHTGDGEPSSNLVLLKDEDPTVLEISRLENVKSTEEAQMIKLLDKQMLWKLKFKWTRDATRFVEDREVLAELGPPCNLQIFELQGYSSLTFPSWMMGITCYLPQLRTISLVDLPWCSALPPLGQLPNLVCLTIEQMHSIREIGSELYGGKRPFPALEQFHVWNMDNLHEWNTICYSDDEEANVLVLPRLHECAICQCPILSFKPCPPICGGSGMRWVIGTSDNVISSGGEKMHIDVGASFNSDLIVTSDLEVRSCQLPLHQWRLLLDLPALATLRIDNCSNLTCSSSDILGLGGLSSLQKLKVIDCECITELPDCLGDLTSLVEISIFNCPGIKRLPKSIKQLTNLQRLTISDDCSPELVQWCESENRALPYKLGHPPPEDRNEFSAVPVEAWPEGEALCGQRCRRQDADQGEVEDLGPDEDEDDDDEMSPVTRGQRHAAGKRPMSAATPKKKKKKPTSLDTEGNLNLDGGVDGRQ